MNEENKTDTNTTEDTPNRENPAEKVEETFRKVMDSFSDAAKKGAEDASKAMEDTVPKVKEAAEQGAYHTAYGLGYAASFGITLAREFVPDIMKSGAGEGVRAGEKAAEDLKVKMKERREVSSDDVVTDVTGA